MSAACGNPAHRELREYLRTCEVGASRRLPQVHHADAREVGRCYARGGIPTLEDLDMQAEAAAECAAEAGYERWLENGGPHAAAIQAEDDIERRREAEDVGLQMMRAERHAPCSGDVHGPNDDECRGVHCVQPRRHVTARDEIDAQAWPLARKAYDEWLRTHVEPEIKLEGIDPWADSVRARAEDLYWDLRTQDREREEDERVARDKLFR